MWTQSYTDVETYTHVLEAAALVAEDEYGGKAEQRGRETKGAKKKTFPLVFDGCCRESVLLVVHDPHET